jgi:hypothetical protein
VVSGGVGSEEKTARVWEAGTGREIARMIHDSRVLQNSRKFPLQKPIGDFFERGAAL